MELVQGGRRIEHFRVKCFEMWWPGTELNRRRQPFQSLANKYFQRLGTHGRHRKSLQSTPGQEFCGLFCGLKLWQSLIVPWPGGERSAAIRKVNGLQGPSGHPKSFNFHSCDISHTRIERRYGVTRIHAATLGTRAVSTTNR